MIRGYFPGARFSTRVGLGGVVECTTYRNGRVYRLQFARVGSNWQRVVAITGTSTKG